MKGARFFFWIFVSLFTVCLIGLAALDYPLIAAGQPVELQVEEQSLSATFYRGSKPFGVVVAGDFGADQVSLRPIVRELRDGGGHVLTLDYSGHGASSSLRLSDQQRLAQMKRELSAGIAELKSRLSYSDEQIILIGHGFGARVILELLQEGQGCQGAVLIAPQINLDENTHSVYLSVIDDTAEGWVSRLNQSSIQVPMQIIGSWKDDLATPESLSLLYQKLTGAVPSLEKGEPGGGIDGNISLTIVPGVFHSFQTSSGKILQEMKEWLRNTLNLRTISSQSFVPLGRRLCWIGLALSLGMTVLLGSLFAANRYGDPDACRTKTEITSLPQFLLWRIPVWLCSLLLVMPLQGLLGLLPGGQPAFSLFSVCLMCSCGLLLLVLYQCKILPGTNRKPLSCSHGIYPIRSCSGLFILIVVAAVVTVLASSGFYRANFSVTRILWLLLTTLLMGFGCFFFHYETIALEQAKLPFWSKPAAWAVFLLPYWIIPLFHLLGGAYTSFWNSLVNLILLVFSLCTGSIVRRLSASPLLAGLSSSFLFGTVGVFCSVLLT